MLEGYFESMGRAMYRVERENLMDELVTNLENTHAWAPSDFNKAAGGDARLAVKLRQTVRDTDEVTLPGGTRLKALNTRLGNIYPEWSISEAGVKEWNDNFRANKRDVNTTDNAGGTVRQTRLEEPRPVWVIDPPRKIVLAGRHHRQHDR